MYKYILVQLPSGCLLDVAITTTPCSNRAVNSLFKIIASAMSVTCEQEERLFKFVKNT